MTAAHPVTGLMPDYANFDRTPARDSSHQDFRFDAWRVAMNIGMSINIRWMAGRCRRIIQPVWLR